MKNDFKQVSHTADIKLIVYGQTISELFCNAVIGMFQTIHPQTDQADCYYKGERLICSRLPIERSVTVDSHDRAMLLVDFLSECLYLSDIHDEAYLDAIVHEIDEQHIKATVMGVPIIGFEVVEIKAVTYYDLSVQQVDEGWQASVVFDI